MRNIGILVDTPSQLLTAAGFEAYQPPQPLTDRLVWPTSSFNISNLNQSFLTKGNSSALWSNQSMSAQVNCGFITKLAKKYQRNNKDTGQKNLRCFPSCDTGRGHVAHGFCGTVVDIYVNTEPTTMPAKYHAWAIFGLANEAQEVKIGEVMKLAAIKTSKERGRGNPSLPWIPGDRTAFGFQFNRSRQGWHYGWPSSVHTCNFFHVLRAYIFQELPGGEGLMRCVGYTESTPFKVFCSRRRQRGSGRSTGDNADASSVGGSDTETSKSMPKRSVSSSSSVSSVHSATPANQSKVSQITTGLQSATKVTKQPKPKAAKLTKPSARRHSAYSQASTATSSIRTEPSHDARYSMDIHSQRLPPTARPLAPSQAAHPSFPQMPTILPSGMQTSVPRSSGHTLKRNISSGHDSQSDSSISAQSALETLVSNKRARVSSSSPMPSPALQLPSHVTQSRVGDGQNTSSQDLLAAQNGLNVPGIPLDVINRFYHQAHLQQARATQMQQQEASASEILRMLMQLQQQQQPQHQIVPSMMTQFSSHLQQQHQSFQLQQQFQGNQPNSVHFIQQQQQQPSLQQNRAVPDRRMGSPLQKESMGNLHGEREVRSNYVANLAPRASSLNTNTLILQSQFSQVEGLSDDTPHSQFLSVPMTDENAKQRGNSSSQMYFNSNQVRKSSYQ